MTNKEAAEMIRDDMKLHHDSLSGEYRKALSMAISALQAQEAKTQLSAKDICVPCKDTISRTEAIDALDGLCDRECEYSKKQRYVMCNACHLGSAFDVIEQLTSAQPVRKKGEWTKDCACEICGFKPWYERDIHTLSFCPNCGADLREDQDDQSK